MLQEQEPMAKSEGQEQNPLTTEETGSFNLNLQKKVFDFSPEDVRGFIKLAKVK
jgi:hypothetical protein